jgi:hypothetical protein
MIAKISNPSYKVVGTLGKGKFSVVYQAKNLEDGRLCALKKINSFSTLCQDPVQRDKCLKEVGKFEV